MTAQHGLSTEIVDPKTYQRAVHHLRERRVLLPSFAQLAQPALIPASVVSGLSGVDPDAAAPENLFRVHWYNDKAHSERRTVPDSFILPPTLAGCKAKIVVVPGWHFPLIGAHKVLAAYGCLVPRLVTGQFDPARQKAVWPSTGNYCRGGVAISQILGCKSTAVLPEGMSRERFDWLLSRGLQPADIIRTPGTESNVKEIYDACAELERDPANVILNQFSEFGNYLAHFSCTGPALAHVFDRLQAENPALRLAAFVAASGSAGTLAAGDYLKEKRGARIAVVEAVECPTLLENGYGAHNIQGIGDKHVPLIHNVHNTDAVVAVSDQATDALHVLFRNPAGRRYLASRRQIPESALSWLAMLGLSGIANIVASIKLARRLDFSEEDVLITVATDSAALYDSEYERTLQTHFPSGFDDVHAGEIFGEHMLGLRDDRVLELSHAERQRIFNLGYFTWVEQRGVDPAAFDRRRSQSFWRDLRRFVASWDSLIADFNGETGLARTNARIGIQGRGRE